MSIVDTFCVDIKLKQGILRKSVYKFNRKYNELCIEKLNKQHFVVALAANVIVTEYLIE